MMMMMMMMSKRKRVVCLLKEQKERNFWGRLYESTGTRFSCSRLFEKQKKCCKREELFFFLSITSLYYALPLVPGILLSPSFLRIFNLPMAACIRCPLRFSSALFNRPLVCFVNQPK